jgi:potassium efflux system protein
MDTTWAGRLAAGFAALLMGVMATRSWGDEPARGGAGSESAATPANKEPGEKAGESGGSAADQTDAKVVRASAQEALKQLDKPAGPDAAAAAAKALREVLTERIHWLDEWDKLREALARFEAEPSLERQATALKADLERLKALQERGSKDPGALLAGVYRNLPGQVTDNVRAEMKETLEAAKNEWNDWKTKLEKLRAEMPAAASNLSPRRVERDQTYQRVAALKSRKEEREAALVAAKAPEEAQLARERLINLAWESRVESQRLVLEEAQLAREAAGTDLKTLELQVLDAHAQLAGQSFEAMQKRYAEVAEAQERKLAREAANEQKRAANLDNPLEKYQARRRAELLEFQAQVLKFENLLPAIDRALDEQRSLADRAVADFAAVKALLDDGKVSHLDALRLNNDFRRIGPERARIVSHELATAATQLTFYENSLNSVEMDLINGARDDRLQYEDLLQRLPPKDSAAAQKVFAAIEESHTRLLERKRLALEKLAARAEETHRQVERRLKTLDDQYGFIRTNIFWVRDQEPIGSVTMAQCQREAVLLGRSLLPLVQEACDCSSWGRVSPEFAVATLALIGLPWPLSRLKKRTAGLRSGSSR